MWRKLYKYEIISLLQLRAANLSLRKAVIFNRWCVYQWWYSECRLVVW